MPREMIVYKSIKKLVLQMFIVVSVIAKNQEITQMWYYPYNRILFSNKIRMNLNFDTCNIDELQNNLTEWKTAGK